MLVYSACNASLTDTFGVCLLGFTSHTSNCQFGTVSRSPGFYSHLNLELEKVGFLSTYKVFAPLHTIPQVHVPFAMQNREPPIRHDTVTDSAQSVLRVAFILNQPSISEEK